MLRKTTAVRGIESPYGMSVASRMPRISCAVMAIGPRISNCAGEEVANPRHVLW